MNKPNKSLGKIIVDSVTESLTFAFNKATTHVQISDEWILRRRLFHSHQGIDDTCDLDKSKERMYCNSCKVDFLQDSVRAIDVKLSRIASKRVTDRIKQEQLENEESI